MTHLSPGIFLFESPKPGPRRLYSAGIHGDEIEGQEALSKVFSLLESGKCKINTGSVMIIFANTMAIQAKRRVATDGRDFNRFFHLDCDERINEIKKHVNDFKPTLHRDLHSTIQKVDYLFALCSRASIVNAADFADFSSRYNIYRIVQFVYPAGQKLTTFAGFTSQHFGTESFTIELGQIGSGPAQKMIPIVTDAIFSEIGEAELYPAQNNSLQSGWHAKNSSQNHLGGELQLWRMRKKITKQTENFHFTRTFNNFEPLIEGEIVATDGDLSYTAGKNSSILFANSSVAIGGRAAVFIEYAI